VHPRVICVYVRSPRKQPDSFTLKMVTVISAKTSHSFGVLDLILSTDSVQEPCNILMVSVL
jgi:hypothetical protein